EIEVRSPISGRIRWLSSPVGVHVAAGTEVASIDPSDDQVWEALRALFLVGRLEDIPVVRLYERGSSEISDRLRQQPALTAKPIQESALRALADALLASDAQDWVHLDASEGRMVLVRHPEHAVHNWTILYARRRSRASRAAFSDHREFFRFFFPRRGNARRPR